MRRMILTAVGIVIFVLGPQLYVRWQFPQMTNSELLFGFWWLWLAQFGVGFVMIDALNTLRGDDCG